MFNGRLHVCCEARRITIDLSAESAFPCSSSLFDALYAQGIDKGSDPGRNNVHCSLVEFFILCVRSDTYTLGSPSRSWTGDSSSDFADSNEKPAPLIPLSFVGPVPGPYAMLRGLPSIY